MYDNLINSGKVSEAEIGNRDEFKAAISDEAKTRQFYKNIIGSRLLTEDEIGSEDDFYGSISDDFATPQPQSPASGGGYQPSSEDMKGFLGTIGGARQTVGQSRQAVNRIGNMQQRAGLDLSQDGRIELGKNRKVTKGQERLNLETGKMESTYVTEAGNEYENRELADMEQNASDLSQYLESVPGQLDQAYKERDRLNQMAEARRKQIEDERSDEGFVSRLLREAGRAAQSDKIPDNTSPSRDWENDREYSDIMAAIRKNNELITTLEDQRDNATNGFWHSFGTEIANGYTFSLGGKARMDDAIALGDAQKHIDSINKKRSSGEELTHEEEVAEAVLKNAAWDQEVQAKYGDDYGAWARAGKMGANSADFMLDFLMMGGMPAGMAKNIMGAVVKGGERYLGNLATKGFGKFMLKATGATLGSMVAGAEITNTIQLGKTASDVAQSMEGDVYKDEKGNYVFGHYEEGGNGEPKFVKGGNDFFEALAQAQRSGISENGSEILGTFLPGGNRIIEALGLSKISRGLTALKGKGWYQNYSKFLETAGFNGVVGEGLEEYGGTAIDALLGGDEWKNLADPRTHIDIWLGVTTMSGILNAPNLIGTGYSAIQYQRYKKATNNADAVASTTMNTDTWSSLRETIDNTDNANMADVAMSILNNDDLSDEGKRAAMNYIGSLQKMRGYSLGSIAAGKDGGESDASREVDEAYTSGYDTQEPDMLKQFKDEAQQSADNLPQFGEEFAKMVTGSQDPVATLNDIMGKRDIYSDEQIAAAADYFQKMSRVNGAMKGALDRIDTEVERLKAEARADTHQQTGNIIMAKGADNTDYYIIGGEIVTDPDTGLTSLTGTGGAVVVKDAITGEISVKSPQEVMVYSMIPAEDHMNYIDTEVRNSLMQQADDDFTFGSPANEVYQLEDTVTLLDGDGNVIEGEIGMMPNAVDGVYVVYTPDGKALQYTADQMNRMIVNHNGMEVQRSGAQPEAQTVGNQPLEQNGTKSVPAGNNQIQPQPQPQQGGGQTGGEASAEDGTGANEQPVSALSKIPVLTDEKGKPVLNRKGKPQYQWHKASVEDAAAALVETTGGDMVMARDTASDLVKIAQAGLEKIRKQKPKGEDPIEIAESRMEIKRQEQEQQAIIKQWQDVNQAIQKQMRDEAAARQAEIEAAKSAEQKAREAEEARIKKEKQDEQDRQRLREAIERDREKRSKEYDPLVKAREEMKDDTDAQAILADTEPRSLEEWVSSMIRPHSMLWQDASDSETGLQSELGLTRGDMQRMMSLLGTKESGAKPFGKVVLDIYEGLPDAMKDMYTDEDVRRTLLDLFNEGSSTRMMHLTEEHRIEEAREAMSENRRRDAEAEMDAWAEAYHLTPEERDTFNEWTQMPPTEPEQEVINQIIADNEQNRTSKEMGGQPVGDGTTAGIEGGEGQVQQAVEAAGNGNTEQGTAEAGKTSTGEPPAADNNVPGGESIFVTPVLNVSLSRRLVNDLAEAYASGDPSAIRFAAVAMKAYVDEGGDFENKESDDYFDYDGDDPQSLALQYKHRILLDRYLDEDDDQEYIKTGLKPGMRNKQEPEKKNSALDNTTDTDETSDRGRRNDTATPQNTVAVDKDTNNSSNNQEKKQESSQKPQNISKRPGTDTPEGEILVKGGTILKNNMAGGDAVALILGSNIDKKTGKRRYTVEYYANEQDAKERSVAIGDAEIGQDEMRQHLANGDFSKERKAEKPAQPKKKEPKRLVSDEKMEELRKKLLDKLNNLNAGIDPEMMLLGAMYAVGNIERGVTKFADYARAMIDGLNDKIRPYLKSFYNAVRDMPEAAEYASQMDDYDTVARFDVYNFDKPVTPNIITRAEQIVTEQKIRKQAQKIQAEQPDMFAGDLFGAQEESPSIGTTSSPEQIASEEGKVDTNPSEAQKEAGNYKKGHIKIDGYDITIENPKGSVRSGVDAKGNAWEQQMHNTYGYIRGTEGVDGDHIDVFLSDDPTSGSVFVVDQINPDTLEFDEHKVMYGFPDAESAEQAYLSNYEEGWGGLGEITEVSREDFKKWVESSHRKTKPFAEYKIAKNQKPQIDKKDYRTYMTPEAREYFAHDPRFAGWSHPELAFITAAVWDGVVIPYDALKVLPEIIEAEQITKNTTANGVLEISDEERDRHAQHLLDSEHGSAVFKNGKIRKVKGVEDFSGPVRQERKALIIIGLPAGGKSSVFANPLSNQYGARIIDSDVVKPWLEGFDGGNGAGYVQNASSDVAERALDIAVGNGDNIILPRIGGKSVITLAAALRLAGYDVQVYYNDVATVTSVDRAASRFAETGRYLSLDYLTSKDGVPSDNFSKFAEKTIGDYLDELSEGEIQKLRGRLAGLLGSENIDGTGLRQPSANSGEGYGSVDEYISALLESGRSRVAAGTGNLNHDVPIFSYAEWKSNDVAFGEKPKEIWNSESETPIPIKKEEKNNETESKVSRKPEPTGKGTGQASGSVGRTGTEPGPESDRPERTGSGHSIENTLGVSDGGEARDSSEGPAENSTSGITRDTASALPKHNNRRNNVGERGKDYAPLSPKARFNANVEAIKMMRALIDNSIEAPTTDQMEVLRKYSGWGGMGTFFNDGTTPEYRQLHDLLSEEELNDAAMSINSAYYTPAMVIDSLWDIAKAMGFKGGNVLEGSAGIGNIIGQMPKDMSRHSNIEAVEIDSISGNILKLLYPDAKVHIQGFQDTMIPNGTVDLAVTNVPFVTGLHVIDKVDKDLSRKFTNIHDFCIAKNIRKLREGGIGIFITSAGTMDKSTKLREWIPDEGQTDVVGAFRLNNKTFGGTTVTSDIIVVRKRVNGQKSPNAIDISKASPLRVGTWTDKYGDEHQVSMVVNDYFRDHPEMMAGKMAFGYEKGDTFRPGSYGLYPVESMDQEKMLADFAKRMEKARESRDVREIRSVREEQTQNQLTAEKEGRMLVDDKGRLCVSERGVAVPLGLNDQKVKGYTKAECFADYQAVQKAVDDVLQQQLGDPDDAALKPKLDALNKAYDKFTKRYGTLHKNTSISFLSNDIDFPSFLALENYSETKDMKGKVTVKTSKAPLFSQRVLGFKTEPKPKSIKDALIASIFRTNGIDLGWITEKLNESGVKPPHKDQWEEEDVRKGILVSRLGFEDPSTGQLEIRYKYLSGNVREKLSIAESYNTDGRYAANVEELRKAVPMDIPSHLIDFSIGSSWIPIELYKDYLKDKYDLDNVKLNHVERTWVLDEGYGFRNEKNRSAGVYSEQFRETIYGHQLVAAALNNRPVKVSKQVSEGWGSSKTTRTVVDQAATQACAVRVDEIKDEFKQWAKKRMQDDPELAKRIEKIYNDKFNALVPMQIDDEFLPEKFDGANVNVSLYDHQKRGVMRGLTSPTMLAHEVGTGKSFTLISTAMEMRRLGTAKKPMIVVQNATVAQMTADAKFLYPNAQVLSLSEKDRSAEGRRAFYAKIKFNDWDLVIVPQSTFERIPDSPERELQFIQEKIDEKKHVIEAAQAAGVDSREIKRLKKELQKIEEEYGDTYLDHDPMNNGQERARSGKSGKKKDAKREAASLDKAETKAKEMLDRAVDDVQYFDDLGVDALLVDEAHEYKHLGFQTSIGRGIKGIDPSYSKKCAGLYNKTRSVFEKSGWKNVVFATGTPISNTAAEIWTFMKYLMPADVMRQNDIYYFDDFVHNFGSISQMLEFSTSGKFKENTRFAAYVNKPELIRIWSHVADTVLTREVGAVKSKVPEKEGGKDQDVFLPQSPSLISIMAAVRAELERYENMTGKEKKENSSIPLTMYGIAKRAAIDPRLVNADAPDEPLSKTNAAVKEIVKDLKATQDYKGTVAVFCDNQNRKGTDGSIEFNIYDDMREKLIAQGVPADQIAIIRSGMSIAAKQKVFDAVNSGTIRVVLGSTQTLGTGVNMQERLHLLIHMDAPDRPMDYTQRNGRIERQGNLHKIWNKSIRIVRFGVEDSLDVTAYQRLKTKSGFIDSIMDGKGALLNNQTDRTVEEEEEGLFDNPVAVLSGSQYALKKNQAERELRKYLGKKAQWEADQVYIANALRYNKSAVASSKEGISSEEKKLAKIRSMFPDGKVKAITVEGVMIDMTKDDGAKKLGEAIKEKISDPVNATVKKLRENQIYNDESQQYTIELDGHAVNFTVSIYRTSEWDGGKMKTVIHKGTQYSSSDLESDSMMSARSVRDYLDEITDQVITGRDSQDRIDAYKARIERINAETEQMRQREGQPFQYAKELEEARKNVEEYTVLMKKEMEEKEAKYAQQQKEAEANGTTFDLGKAEDNSEDDDDVLRRSDEDYDDKVYSQAFKDYFGDWENDPGNASKVVDENGTPQILHHGTNLSAVNGGNPFWIFRPGSHFGTQGQADDRVKFGSGTDQKKIYNVYLNIRNPKRVRDVPLEWLEDEDGTHSEWWEKQIERAKYQGYDGLVYLNEYEDTDHPADSWIAFYPEQIKSADENIGTYDRTNPDIRYRGAELFEEGQTFTINMSHTYSSYDVTSRRASYSTDLLPDEFPTIQSMLDAIRNQYPEYYVAIEDGQVRMQSWGNVMSDVSNARKKAKGKESYVNRKTRQAIDAIEQMAQKMNLDVEILTSTEGLTGRNARSKGFFNKRTHKITIVLPNHRTVSDVINTLLHEGVAHYGLRKMFGSNFDTFVDNVYNNVDPEIRARIDAAMKRNGWSRHVATEEYLARLAERTDFEHAQQSGWWTKIKNFFLDMLAKAGFSTSLSDNELRYILWRSYDNLLHPGDRRNIFDTAREIRMESRLGVGRYERERQRLKRTGKIDTSRIVADREPQQMQEGDVLDQESVDALNAEIKAMKEADEMGLIYRSDDDWDDEAGDVMVEPFEDSADIARAIYEKAAASDALKFQESWQDKMAGLKILQNAIEKETGHKATGAEDAYLYENRMHGKAKNQSENYDRRFYKPVLKAADAMMKAKGWTDIRQLTDYMVAKHGLERNIFYAFKEAVTGMVRDTINKEQRKLSKRYERGEIDALTYKKEQKELEERLDKDVASKIMEVHNDQRHIDNKADYEAGRKTYSQYIAEEEDIRRDYAPDFDDHYKDYSGLTELTGEDSDYTTEALAMVDDAELNAHDEERILWDAVNAATKETLRFAYESGTMSRNTYNNVRAMFDYYIPLRGWEEDNADDFYEYVSERNVFSTAVKKAYGRKSLAENPIAYIGNMAVSTLLAGHRNLLKQHFLNYVMNNPTSLVSVSEKWWENKGTETSPYWVEVAPEIPANATADEIADIVEAFNEDMKQKAEQGKATTRRGSLQIAYHATGAEKNEHMVEVQRAGKAYQLYINGNPKAAQALNGINEKAVSRISQTDFGKLIEKINRSMAAFFTSKNPAFVLSNLSRDLTMAGASVAVKEDAAYNRRFIANVFKVLRPRIGKASRYNIYGRMTGGQSVTGLLPSLMRKYLDGDLDLSNETERLFGEFMDEGAETGFVNMLSVDSFKEKMQKEIARMQGTTLNIVKAKNGTKETPVGKGLRMMGDIFEFYNRCAEDATRFIVYMTSRQMGKSLEDSIADAKDVTLNFNRKGTGAQWNAVVRDLFIFVNPAIQALSNMFKMAYKHPLKMTAVTAAFMAGGAMMPVINQWLLNLFGDDDDKDAYWNLPAWVRKNNLVMWVPGTKNFVTIPLAQEFRVFYGLGEMASSLTYDHPVHEWPMEILSSFMDLIPINPTGNGGNLAVDLTPTTLQPLMQLHDNVDFTGKPIWKENQGNKYAPMYTKAYITTPEWMISLSETVNDVTGGNEGKKGWVEENLYGGDYINNPAVWNHLMQGYFGGMYNTIAKGFDVITTGAKGELPKIYQTPVVNRFLNRPVERDNAGVLGEEYYRLTEERDRLRYELRTWQKKAADGEEGAQDRVDEIMESDDYQRMLVIDHYDKIMKDLKAGEKAAATDADKADIKESITMYKAEMLEELTAIDGGEDPLAAAKRKFDEAKTFAEKNRLRVRIERLTGRDVRARKGDGRNDEVRKALAYREDDERESRKVNDKYLELATAENIADDARIRAARLRIKAVTDEAKRLQREGRAEEAIRYQKQHSREINTGDLIESMTRTMNSNKKFLGKGHDEAIMKLIDANRRRMLKAIDDLE